MKKYIVANWKSNKTLSETTFWLNNFPNQQESKQALANLEIILAPPYPFLSLCKAIIVERQLPIKLAVQDLSAFGRGAYTGEVSAYNLQDLSIDYALVGHSERRRFLAESSALIADKIHEALSWKIKPILCLDQPYFLEQAQFLSSQALTECFLAYEPLGAIGSGQAESPGDILAIRQQLTSIYGHGPIFYGGSVHADNIAAYLRVCEGVLLGGASLELQNFIDLLYAASKTSDFTQNNF